MKQITETIVFEIILFVCLERSVYLLLNIGALKTKFKKKREIRNTVIMYASVLNTAIMKIKYSTK